MFVVILPLGATPLHAQVAWEGGPLVASYRPMGRFDRASVSSTTLPTTPSALRGTAWGGGLSVWIAPRWGLHTQGTVASSTIAAVATPNGLGRPTSARVTTVTLEVQYALLPPTSQHRVWVSAGPSLVRHGGDAYTPFDAPRAWGGIVGFGASQHVWAGLHAAVTVSANGYTYTVTMPSTLAANPGPLQSGVQRDVFVQLGLVWQSR